MEPTNQTPDTKPLKQGIYSAVGWIAGTYKPSAENVVTGIFTTTDGLSVPAKFTRRLRCHLEKKHPTYASQPDFFQQPQRWTVYPKTEPLQFDLVVMKPLLVESVDQPPLDEFRMVGEIESCRDSTVSIRIQRNHPEYQGKKTKKPRSFVLTLDGSLPVESVGQLWSLVVKRIAEKLVVVDAKPYEPSEQDLVILERNAKKLAAALATTETEVELKQDALALAVEPSLSEANTVNDSTTGAVASVTQVSADGVSIAESQANVVNESNLQAVATTEQLVSNTNTSTRSETEAVFASQSKFKVQSTPNPNAFARPQRLPSSKTSKLPTQHLAKTDSQTTTPIQGALTPIQPQQQQLLKKQLNASTAKVELKSKKPVFQVKVNDRIFSGYDSVTLINRMVCIDGKPVAQAKMIIVLGQPQTMQADGKVAQGNNQAVLTSR